MLVSGSFLIEKFRGKGGWTYIKVPLKIQLSNLPFGMIRVSGSVDQIAFKGKHLMPFGGGNLFLPIPKPLLLKLKKEVGQTVSIELFEDKIPTEIPSELIDCLSDIPGKLERYLALSDAEKKRWITYIFESKKEETKAERIIKLINSLA
ncbi:DUF1905 domain-containing protein [Algoriphagus sp. SE2]|uniref:DUF1905 domain-containing protein n=1 Tax=Algoriphagus sp. SE2 TaxID=3141536 RepID=UPI0031CD9D8F